MAPGCLFVWRQDSHGCSIKNYEHIANTQKSWLHSQSTNYLNQKNFGKKIIEKNQLYGHFKTKSELTPHKMKSG